MIQFTQDFIQSVSEKMATNEYGTTDLFKRTSHLRIVGSTLRLNCRSKRGRPKRKISAQTCSSCLNSHTTTTMKIVLMTNSRIRKKPRLSFLPLRSFLLRRWSHKHLRKKARIRSMSNSVCLIKDDRRFGYEKDFSKDNDRNTQCKS